jgi:hypothetical protein
MVFSHGLRVEEAILQHYCLIKYVFASSSYHASNSDMTDAPQRTDDCETPSKVVKKISAISCLPRMKNSKVAHVTSQLFNERKKKLSDRQTKEVR